MNVSSEEEEDGTQDEQNEPEHECEDYATGLEGGEGKREAGIEGGGKGRGGGRTHSIRNTPPQCDNVVRWSGSLFFLKPNMPITIPTRPTITVTRANEQITMPKAYLHMAN